MTTFAPYAKDHRFLHGAGDARPTALKIISDQDLYGKWKGKVCVVTGASGIGIETVRALHATGADVYVTGRDATKAQEAIAPIVGDGRAGKVEYIHLELDSLASVKSGAAEILEKTGGRINILVLNAGIMCCPESKTKDGFETQFGTNHLGHFALYKALEQSLLSSATPDFNSRVVSVSSLGNRGANVDPSNYNLTGVYTPLGAYCASKTANTLMVTEIERQHASKNLHALAVHPGLVDTNLARHLSPEALRDLVGPNGRGSLPRKNAAQGAATSVLAAVAKELEGKGALYLEDCGIGKETAEKWDGSTDAAGFGPWAFDGDMAKRLWEDSLKMIAQAGF